MDQVALEFCWREAAKHQIDQVRRFGATSPVHLVVYCVVGLVEWNGFRQDSEQAVAASHRWWWQTSHFQGVR